jgi:hypothetical protein
MKYAASIKLGGELVAAVDSDYGDYKRLQLLCPNCKEPVFLQSLSKRVLGEKEVSVCPHFKHFSIPDASLSVQCEQRVSAITEDDITKARAIARGQRLKKLQAGFWRIFINKSHFSGHCKGCIEATEKDLDSFCKQRKIAIRTHHFTLEYTAQDFYKEYIQETDLKSFLENRQEVLTTLKSSINNYFENPVSKDWTKHKEVFEQSVNTKIQSLILGEIVDFLSAKSSKHLLFQCTSLGIILCCHTKNKEMFQWFRSSLFSGIPLWELGINAFVMELVKIDWDKALSYFDDLDHITPLNKSENCRTKSALIIEQLISLPDFICIKLFEIANSREVIGGLIEIPAQDTNMEYLINHLVPNDDESERIRRLLTVTYRTQVLEYAKRREQGLVETDIEKIGMQDILNSLSAPTAEEKKNRAYVIKQLIEVCSFQRKENWKIWCDIYEVLSMLDSSNIVDALKNKSRSEVDSCLKAMLLLQGAYPSPDTEEELWGKYYEKNIIPSPNELKDYLFQHLSFLGEETNKAGTKYLEEFCERIGKLLHNNWNSQDDLPLLQDFLQS